jgi:multiple sugar transport system permease protein
MSMVDTPLDATQIQGNPVTSPVRRALIYFGLTVLAIVMAMPFVAMILMSLRPPQVTGLTDIFFSLEFTLDNYKDNLRNDSMVRWFLNSFIYAFVSVVGVLTLCTMAGYAFAKKKFFARDQLFWVFIAMLVVPAQVTLIPLFILVVQLDGANTYWGLILPTLASAQGVFLMRQYIMGIPDDLIEAAKIDGASEFRIFWQIIVPLTIPVQATLGIFVFLWHWNDFLWPLIVAQSSEMQTLTVGLATLQSLVPSTNSMMAAAAISFFPSLIIFIFCQRFIVQSVISSGIKG